MCTCSTLCGWMDWCIIYEWYFVLLEMISFELDGLVLLLSKYGLFYSILHVLSFVLHLVFVLLNSFVIWIFACVCATVVYFGCILWYLWYFMIFYCIIIVFCFLFDFGWLVVLLIFSLLLRVPFHFFSLILECRFCDCCSLLWHVCCVNSLQVLVFIVTVLLWRLFSLYCILFCVSDFISRFLFFFCDFFHFFKIYKR